MKCDKMTVKDRIIKYMCDHNCTVSMIDSDTITFTIKGEPLVKDVVDIEGLDITEVLPEYAKYGEYSDLIWCNYICDGWGETHYEWYLSPLGVKYAQKLT